MCRGPKYHSSPMSPIPRALWNKPKSHGIYIFFFNWEEGKGTVKECKSEGKWKCYGHCTIFWAEYFNKSHVCKSRAGCYQVHCMYFHLTFSMALSHRGLNDCKGTLRWATNGVVFLVVVLTSMGKRAWWVCMSVPLNSYFSTLDIWVCSGLRCVNSPTCYQKYIAQKAHTNKPTIFSPSHLINTCRAWSGLTSIIYCFRTIIIVNCLFICKCTVVPVVPDFRVACNWSSLLNSLLLNLHFHQWISSYSFSANCEQNVRDIRKCLGKRTRLNSQINLVLKSLIQRNHSVMQTRARHSWPPLSLINYLHNRRRKCYKKRLSYKKVWEKVYPWVQYEDPNVGKFCTLCKKWRRPLPSTKGGWMTREIVDWKHGTELLKLHSGFKWHQDSSITARMAKHVEQQNVIEMQCAGAAEQAEEKKKKNHEIILELMRSIYFLVKNHIPHSTTYMVLIELKV